MTRDRHTNNLKHGLLITEHLQNNTEIFIETLLTIYIKCIKQSPCNMSLMLLVLSFFVSFSKTSSCMCNCFMGGLLSIQKDLTFQLRDLHWKLTEVADVI